MASSNVRLEHRVSCIVPAFNEAATIGEVVRGLLANVPNVLEVIVVDDGSADQTARVAREAGAVVLRLERNSGKGVAVRKGLQMASGNVVLLIDADGQDNPAEAKALLARLTPDVEMVLGSRFLGTFEAGAISLVHRLGNRFLTLVFNILFGQRLTDAQAGFRAFWRDAVCENALIATRFEVEADLNTLVALRKGRILEVPVSRGRRTFGRSGFKTFADGLRILWLLLRRRFTIPNFSRKSLS